MLFLKSLLLLAGFGFLAGAAALIAYDIYLAFELDRILRRGKPSAEAQAPGEPTGQPLTWRRPRRPIRWNEAAKLVLTAAALGLMGASIVVVPDGHAAVRVSQISGVLPGTLYAGTHFIMPLVERVELYDVRDEVFSTAAAEGPHEKNEALIVEAREGLPVGLAVTVRYRIDPQKLSYIQANLPRPLDEEIVAPAIVGAFHALAPNYIVRDIFSTKREEFRVRAAQAITQNLAGDGIEVKEVLLRKIVLPEEYAKGLEDLLLKEQEDDETSVDAEIEAKRVQIAASQAEALKVREVKHAEADAQSRVIMAKSDSDSMQYTLPLKQKQIEQSRLEAEAAKETTIQNAEASAQAKVIDSKAEQQRENLLANAEANRIRVTAQAHAQELQLEASALKANPLLVQYTVAQKLSDKVQIMLVPSDSKFFFTNDVLRSAVSADAAAGDPPAQPAADAKQ